MPLEVTPQHTPNPNALKFNLSAPIAPGKSRSYASKASAASDPLAARLFDIPGVSQVFMLNDFITVTKSSDADWEEIQGPAEAVILAEFARSAAGGGPFA
jgi:hypothetical protein